jgi:copper chaperone CopZ
VTLMHDDLADAIAPCRATLSRMETVRLSIEGMTGAACVNSVTRALTALPGVAQADVSLTKARAKVAYDPAQTSVEAMKQAIARAGYKAA